MLNMLFYIAKILMLIRLREKYLLKEIHYFGLEF